MTEEESEEPRNAETQTDELRYVFRNVPTYQNSKIAETPTDEFQYMFEAWGGRTSDKFLTENCGFLDKLLPGDKVMADRGSTIDESVNVGLKQGKLVIQAFTKGKAQLDPIDVERSRGIANIDLQFLSKPLGGPSSRHFFPSKRATYYPDFVTPACVDHEISKLEVQLQYHNKPLGGPKSNHFQIDLQFLSKPLGGPSSRHFFPSKRATYYPDFVTPACVDHEISKLEVQLQYHNKPLGGPKSNHFQIDLQFLSKPLGGPSSRHFFPSKRATYYPDFVTPACVDHEISKLEVQLQYHNKPLGGPNTQVKVSVYVRQSPGRRNFPA
ncbi:hypothetical protein Bbelb_133690 [Branchiostoma belcheri]|nr:hypothetical protein Bbelb_133690 [Branchiostoma belcheri]